MFQIITPTGGIFSGRRNVLLDQINIKDMIGNESDLMDGIKQNIIYELKHKASIPIEKSVVLLGVSDYTGTLESNEIFV